MRTYLQSVVAIGVVFALSGTSSIRTQKPTPKEVFAETLHEVREVRGVAIGKRVDFDLRARRDLAVMLRDSIPGFAEDARVFAKLGVVHEKLDAKKKLGDVLARMMSVRYDAKTSNIVVPKESQKLGRYVAKLLGAYGVSLATDTVRYGLTKRFREADTFDQRFVLLALHEGAAMTTMGCWAIDHRQGWTMPERLGLRKWESARIQASTQSPRLFSTTMAAALTGRFFLAQGKGSTVLLPEIPSGTTNRIEQAWKRLPKSSEQILHPKKYWARSGRDVPVVMHGEKEILARLAEICGEDITGVNTLGEFGCAIATSPRIQPRIAAKAVAALIGKPSYWSARASTGWGGDRVFTFGRGETASIAWITMWDSDKDAREFHGAYTKSRGTTAGAKGATHGKVAVFGTGKLAGKTGTILDLVFEHADAKKGSVAYPLRRHPASAPK